MIHSLQLPTDETSAAAWLLSRGWIYSPDECIECEHTSFSELLWSSDRPPHWRCKSCECRAKMFDNSIFVGMRVSALELVKLLGHYVSTDLTQCPNVPDFVQV